MNVPENKTSIEQSLILKRMQRYIDYQAKKLGNRIYQELDVKKIMESLDPGHCSGLVGLWFYRKSKREESIFFGNLKLISEWDGSPEQLEANDRFLAKIFEQFINDMRWGQEDFKLIKKKPISKTFLSQYDQIKEFNQRREADRKIRQPDLPHLFEVVKSSPQSSLQQEFRMDFVFKRDELLETLSRIIKEGKMIRIASEAFAVGHVIGLMFIDGRYCIYDPNEPNGELQFDSLNEILDEIEKTLFKKFNRKADNMDLHIGVFDWQKRNTDENAAYPEDLQENLARSFFDKKGDRERRSYNGATSLSTAAKSGSLTMIDFLIREGADYNAKDDNNYTPLIYAAANGYKDVLNRLLKEKGIDYNAQSIDGESALIAAAKGGYLDSVEILCKISGINVNLTDQNGNSALSWAIINNHPDVVEFLINQKEVNIAHQNKYGSTPLIIAAFEGRLELVKLILKKPNIDLNAKNKNGYTALYIAAAHGFDDIVKLLLEKKADIDSVASDNSTSLHVAVRENQISTVKLLLSQHCNINIRSARTGLTPFQEAIKRNQIGIVKIFLENADINDINSAIHGYYIPISKEIQDLLFEANIMQKVAAANQGKIKLDENDWCMLLFKCIDEKRIDLILKLLHENPKLFLLQDKEGNTGLHYLVTQLNNYPRDFLGYHTVKTTLEILNLFFQHQANSNLINKEGNTPLHLMVKFLKLGNVIEDEKKLVIYAFLEKVNVNAIDEKENTPLHIAYAYNKKFADFLLEKKARLDIDNKSDEKPLYYLLNNGNCRIEDLKKVINAGFDPNTPIKGNQTALDVLVNDDNIKTDWVKFLLDNGAKIEERHINPIRKAYDSYCEERKYHKYRNYDYGYGRQPEKDQREEEFKAIMEIIDKKESVDKRTPSSKR